MEKNTPTLGATAIELLGKADAHLAVDVQYATEKEYLKKLEEIIEKHLEYANSYYIQILTLQENFHRRNLPNIYKFMFVVRKTRPLPQHDCCLFSYDNRRQNLKFHWIVPDAQTCDYLIENENELPSSEKELFKFSKSFCMGTLV